MAFYSYLSTKIIIAFITKSYQDLFGVRSYINAFFNVRILKRIAGRGGTLLSCLYNRVIN